MEPNIHEYNEQGLCERLALCSLIGFDLDNTLACSKKPMTSPMCKVFGDLINKIPVALITGGDLRLVKSQVLSVLPASTNLDNFHIMPTNGTSYYRIVDGSLKCVYSHTISVKDANRIISVVKDCAKKMGLLKSVGDKDLWGSQIENRGTQITFSALGQLAPIEFKKDWDPSGKLKEQLAEQISAYLPDFSVRAGGETSVDIVCKGNNKAYALDSLCKICGISLKSVAFVGDRMYKGGNDYPTSLTGALAICVKNPSNTFELCSKLLESLK